MTETDPVWTAWTPRAATAGWDGRQGDQQPLPPPLEPDGPVFVDGSGRRSRHFRRLGTLIGAACTVYAVAIVTTMLSGNSAAPGVPFTFPEQAVPTGPAKVVLPPTEAATASPSTQGTPPSATGRPRSSESATRSKAPVRSPSPHASASSAPTPHQTTRGPLPSPTGPKPTPTRTAYPPATPHPGTPPGGYAAASS